MKKVTIISLIFTLFIAVAANAQSADKVTEMIETKETTWGQACYFAASYSGFISEDDTEVNAISALQKQGYFKSIPDESAPISLKDFSGICVKTFDIKGSILYSVFKTPRYAFRLLKAYGIISSASDPSKTSTGHEALNIFTSCMDAYGKEGE